MALPLAAQSPGAPPALREPSVLRPLRLAFLPAPAFGPQWRARIDTVLRSTAVSAAAADTTKPKTAPDTTKQKAADLFGQYADLGLALNARLESKLTRTRNERCISSQLFTLASQCSGTFQPLFDFQFDVRTGGTVADRVHLNVDYDSKREFDASNNIQVYYEGKKNEWLQKLEVGNVSFLPPASRFITGGIPSNNYGLQAAGQIGAMRFRTIIAQQKGNVILRERFDKEPIEQVTEGSERGTSGVYWQSWFRSFASSAYRRTPLRMAFALVVGLCIPQTLLVVRQPACPK